MSETVAIKKEEYNLLKHKAEEFDKLIDSEVLTKEEFERLLKARETKSLSEKEFLKRHPELS